MIYVTYGVTSFTFATSVKSSNARKVLDFVGGFMYKLRCFFKGQKFYIFNNKFYIWQEVFLIPVRLA